MIVAVCVATFRRPRMLADLLEALASQEGEHLDRVRVVVTIVDNDPYASARSAVESCRNRLRWEVRYAHEARRGIAAARNTGVAVALSLGADVIVMIDDDERPHSQWLANLLATRERYRADVVYGPVVPVYPKGTPEWIVRGRFFERTRVPTGEVVRSPGTGNILISRRILEGRILPFSVDFGLTGGEDALFFATLQREGVDVISCDEAVVEESVTSERATLRYVTRRAFGAGAVFVRVQHTVSSNSLWWVRRALSGVMRVAGGLLLAGTGWIGGIDRSVRGIQMLALGAGTLAGLCGARFERYRTSDGS